MSQAPTTPKSEVSDEGPTASWLPRDIPYNSAFEDSVCDILTITDSSSSNVGLRVIPRDSFETAEPGESIHARDIPSSTLPEIPFSSLPLPLSDARRKYASPIPGINLTHPGGYLEGGPGIAASDDEFARHFVLEHKICAPAELEATVAREIAANLELAKARMEKRKEAREKNERVRREIKALSEDMDLEIKVLVKAREKAKERRERKERRRAAAAG